MNYSLFSSAVQQATITCLLGVEAGEKLPPLDRPLPEFVTDILYTSKILLGVKINDNF